MKKLIIGFSIFFCLQLAYAIDVSSISFFASNNKDIIKPKHAYKRMLSEVQDQLKHTMTDIMQSNHMEQNNNEDIIGMYQIENDGNLTADNTEIFTTSPYQLISDNKAFELATQMAIALQQESVAVFIPDEQANIADTIVHLNSHPYRMDEILKLVKEKLPSQYANAFSLHFNAKYHGFEKATITSIEWLGSSIDSHSLYKVFPNEELTFKHGKAFLVFKDGQKKEI